MTGLSNKESKESQMLIRREITASMLVIGDFIKEMVEKGEKKTDHQKHYSFILKIASDMVDGLLIDKRFQENAGAIAEDIFHTAKEEVLDNEDSDVKDKVALTLDFAVSIAFFEVEKAREEGVQVTDASSKKLSPNVIVKKPLSLIAGRNDGDNPKGWGR